MYRNITLATFLKLSSKSGKASTTSSTCFCVGNALAKVLFRLSKNGLLSTSRRRRI